MDEIAIYGAGGFGREVAWLIREINRRAPTYSILGFIDDNPALVGKVMNECRVLGSMEVLKEIPGVSLALAVGDPFTRIEVVKRLEPYDVSFPNLTHPSVLIGDGVTMGMGNILCTGVIVTVNVRIGNFCHFNLKTSIGHDCVTEDFATTACSVDFAGFSHIGTGSYFGNHATVLPSRKVGSWSVIGAGAVVNRDIPPGAVAVGVPARVIRENVPMEEMRVGQYLPSRVQRSQGGMTTDPRKERA